MERPNPSTTYFERIGGRLGRVMIRPIERSPGMNTMAKKKSKKSADPKEFTTEGTEELGEDDLVVPKAEVNYQLWNRLIGVNNPARTGQRPK